MLATQQDAHPLPLRDDGGLRQAGHGQEHAGAIPDMAGVVRSEILVDDVYDFQRVVRGYPSRAVCVGTRCGSRSR